MSQISFSDAEYAGKRKKTRREVFLEEMDVVVPWKALLGLMEPHYPVAGRGRRPYPLESMLRVHLMQNWFALSDPAMDEALYEFASLRAFAHLSLSEPIPDETTILNFRHMLEESDLAEDIFAAVNKHLARKGLLLKKKREYRKASVRAKVEHPFRVIKRQFGLTKVRFRGLVKNTAHVVTLFALSNLWMARKKLMAMAGVVRPHTA